MVDYDGNKPGDLFDTMDEAAKDFAEYINAKSIEENRGYASYIYTKTIQKTMIKTYSNFSGWGSNLFSWLWNMVFRSGHNEPQVTKYTYREPKRGTVDRSSPPINLFGIHTYVALR